MKFEFLKSNKGYQFSGIFHIFPKIFEDSRGFFYESWNQDEFNKLVNKEFRAHELAFMTHQEMRPDLWNNLLEEKRIKDERELPRNSSFKLTRNGPTLDLVFLFIQ